MILDWEDALPTKELELAELNFKSSDLCLCLGKNGININSVLNFWFLTRYFVTDYAVWKFSATIKEK